MTSKVEIISSNGVVEVDIDGQVSENVDIDAANIEVLETNAGGLSTIFGASDTNFNSLADKDALFYDVATGEWINSPAYFEYIKTNNFVGLPVHMETLQQWIDHIYSAGRVHGLELTDNLDGTVDIASGVSIMRAVDDPHTALYSVNIDGVSDLALTNNQTNFIYAEYNAVTPTINVTLNPNDINLTTKIPLFVVVREGAHLSIYNVGEDSVDSNASLRKRFFYTEKFRRADGGAIIYDSGALHIGCTAGEFYFGLTSFTFNAFDTTGADTFEYYRLINSVWIRADESTVSNTEYNDISVGGSESLVSLGASKYVVHWVYLIGSTTNPHFAVVYSQDFYSNLAGAEAATVPSNVPPSIEGLGILLGRVIARQGDSEIISTDSSFTETFSSSLATSHNGLADLQGGLLNEYYHLTSDEYTGFQVGSFTSSAISENDGFIFDTDSARTTGNLFAVKDDNVNKFIINSDGTVIVFNDLDVKGNCAVGITSTVSDLVTLNVSDVFPYTSGGGDSVCGQQIALSISGTPDIGNDVCGLSVSVTDIQNQLASPKSSIAGNFDVVVNSTKDRDLLSAVQGRVVTLGSGVVTESNIYEAVALFLGAKPVSSNGFYSGNMGSSGVNVAAGVYIENQSGATDNHGVILAGDGIGSDVAFGLALDDKIYHDGANLFFDVANGISIKDSKNVVVGTSNGTKFATSTAQKLGFWNASPVVQPSGVGEAAGFVQGSGSNVQEVSTFTGNIGSTAYRINDIVKALKQCGIIAA